MLLSKSPLLSKHFVLSMRAMPIMFPNDVHCSYKHFANAKNFVLGKYFLKKPSYSRAMFSITHVCQERLIKCNLCSEDFDGFYKRYSAHFWQNGSYL